MTRLEHLGRWTPGIEGHSFSAQGIAEAARKVRRTVAVVQDPETGIIGTAIGGSLNSSASPEETLPLIGVLPPLYPEWLGDRGFNLVHGLRFPYIGGAMANGIATTRMVRALAEIGCLGFFGAAGLSLAQIESAIDELENDLTQRDLPWGSNLIHSPHEPELEEAVADLYIRRSVKRVSASAYMGLTPAIVRYALKGVELRNGRIHRENHVFAKISRPEVARRFLEPAPQPMLEALAASGALSSGEAKIGASLPIAENITVEADSGGHTDNQVLSALFSQILRLRDEISCTFAYERPIFVGAAGGLGTPDAVAAAFALGAAYVLTGSVNQACYETGLSESGRALLASAGPGDVSMAPAADMFELGAEVQVLSRGTMFAVRAKKLYDLYRSHQSLDDLDEADLSWLVKDIFRQDIEAEWLATEAYWQERDPREAERARTDEHFKMALVFRSYLGQSSRWAIGADENRRMDFQIWCGPAMGAFNAWSEDSFLHDPEDRSVAQVALNFLEGAAVITRAQQLRSFGVPVPAAAFEFRPRRLSGG